MTYHSQYTLKITINYKPKNQPFRVWIFRKVKVQCVKMERGYYC